MIINDDDGVYIADKLDSGNEIFLNVGASYFYLNKDKTITLINHLIKVFNLSKDDLKVT